MWLTQKHRDQGAVPSLETVYAMLYLKTELRSVDSRQDEWISALPYGECRGVLSTSVGQKTAQGLTFFF